MADGVCRGFAIHVYPEDLTRSLKPVHDVLFFNDPRCEFPPLERSFVKEFDNSCSIELSDDGRLTPEQLKDCLDNISCKMDFLLQDFLDKGIELNFAYICHNNDNSRNQTGKEAYPQNHRHYKQQYENDL